MMAKVRSETLEVDEGRGDRTPPGRWAEVGLRQDLPGVIENPVELIGSKPTWLITHFQQTPNDVVVRNGGQLEAADQSEQEAAHQ